MVKLEPAVSARGTVFYFHTMRDCKAFLYVFEDHFCNVPWEKPVEAQNFPEMTASQRKAMDQEPKQRADKNLGWGFSLVRYYGIEDTDEQKAFIAEMVRKFK